MNQAVKTALIKSIQDGLAALQPLMGACFEMHLVWKRQGQTGWQGEYEMRPSLRKAFIEGGSALMESAKSFASCFVISIRNIPIWLERKGSVK